MNLFKMTGDARFVPGLVVILILLLITKSFITRVRRYLRLRHIPGPLSTGWSRLWLLRQAVSGNSHLAFIEVNKKYGAYHSLPLNSIPTTYKQPPDRNKTGPIAKVGPYHVITTDPDLIRSINAVRSPYTRGEWFKNSLRFHPDKDNVVTMQSVAEHNDRRAKMAAGYSGKDLGYNGVEAAVDRSVISLVRMIEDRYIAHNKPFDFGPKAMYFTLDVIADLAYGEPFGFLSHDEDRFRYLAITEKTFAMFLSVTIYPWVYDIMASRIFMSILPSGEDRTGFGRFMA